MNSPNPQPEPGDRRGDYEPMHVGGAVHEPLWPAFVARLLYPADLETVCVL